MQNIIENRDNLIIDYTGEDTRIKRYSHKHKRNILLRFKDIDDTEVLSRVKAITSNSIVL